MSLIPMNVEQMRRKALENSKAKLQQQKDFKNQVDNMSRHDVGGLYDVRQIMKSKQFKGFITSKSSIQILTRYRGIY